MCKPCDVIKSKVPREQMSPTIACLCEGQRRKVKVEWKTLQSKRQIYFRQLFDLVSYPYPLVSVYNTALESQIAVIRLRTD